MHRTQFLNADQAGLMRHWTTWLTCASFALGLLAGASRAASLPISSGLQLHLDASDSSTIKDFGGNNPGQVGFTGNVKTWEDKSLNHYVADAGGSPAAVYNATGLGGAAPALQFSGFDARRMNIPAFSHGGDLTFIAVFRPTVVNGNDQIFNTGNGAGGGASVLELNGGNLTGRTFVNGTATNTGIVSTPVATNANYLAAYLASNNTANGARLVLDGISRGTATTGDISTIATAATVGNHPTGNNAYNGDLAELIVYDRPLSAAEENAVGLYLEQKYGLDTTYTDYAEVASVNFAYNLATTLDAPSAVGAVRAPNWNNIDVAGSRSFPSQILLDANGNPTSITISSDISPGFAGNSNGIGTSTPDHAMMDGGLFFDNEVVGGLDSGTITVSGLDGFAAEYDVFVYLDGGSNNNRTLTLTIAGQSLTLTDLGGFNGAFIEASNSDGDYLRFRNLSGDSFTILAVSDVGRAGISGLQIVATAQFAAVPEPSSCVLLAGGLALAFWGLQRRGRAQRGA